MRWLMLFAIGCLAAQENPPDLLAIPPDLQNPPLSTGTPSAGKQVLQWLPGYEGTEVAHTLYLPADWKPGKSYPVLVEYFGNGKRVRDGGGLGYGLSGGKGFLWVVLPFVSPDGKTDLAWWWGDVTATVSYAKAAVAEVCAKWGGDPKRVVLVGHSRGAIAGNYIGLHDDSIAKLWRAMILMSHYDNDRFDWARSTEEKALAPARLRRLGSRPQLICGEQHLASNHRDDALQRRIREDGFATFTAARQKLGLVPMSEQEGIRAFVTEHHPQANVTYLDLPYVNHTPDYVLRDIPERQQMRAWLQRAIF